MTFDNILGLLAVIFFVVVPLITSVTKGREQRGDKDSQPGGKNWQGGDRTGQPGPRPGQQPQQASGQPATPTSADDSLEARLREARRRIEEALSEPHAQTGTQTGTQTRQMPPPQPRPASQGGATVLTSTLSGETVAVPLSQSGVDWQAPPTTTRSARPPRPPVRRRERPEGRHDSHKDVSEDLQVTRLPPSGPYTRGRTATSRESGSFMGAGGVINGIIWHQILSEPPSRRLFRRRTSRLRSP